MSARLRKSAIGVAAAAVLAILFVGGYFAPSWFAGRPTAATPTVVITTSSLGAVPPASASSSVATPSTAATSATASPSDAPSSATATSSAPGDIYVIVGNRRWPGPARGRYHPACRRASPDDLWSLLGPDPQQLANEHSQ